MAVPLTLNTGWEVWAWVCTMFFLGGLGSMFPLLRSSKLLSAMYGVPTWMPMFLYHFLHVIVYAQWAISGFLIYWHYDPLAPTVPGTWDKWWLNLIWVMCPPVLNFFHHLAGWYWMAWWASWGLLLFMMLFEILALILTIVVGVQLILPGLLYIIPIVIHFALLIYFWSIWRCFLACDYAKLKDIWFCSCMKKRTDAKERYPSVNLQTGYGTKPSNSIISSELGTASIKGTTKMQTKTFRQNR